MKLKKRNLISDVLQCAQIIQTANHFQRNCCSINRAKTKMQLSAKTPSCQFVTAKWLQIDSSTEEEEEICRMNIIKL